MKFTFLMITAFLLWSSLLYADVCEKYFEVASRSFHIPRLPSLQALKDKVAAGAPTERIKRLKEHDAFTSVEILLKGEAWSINFDNLLIVFKKAGIETANLTPAENEFLLTAVSLHIARKLRQGSIRDLEGVDKVLSFLNVTEFTFSEEYMAAFRFWLQTTRNGHAYLLPFTRHGEITAGNMRKTEYRSTHISRSFLSSDWKTEESIIHQLDIENHRIQIEIEAGIPKENLTNDIMEDFLGVREVLIAYDRATRFSTKNADEAPALSLQKLLEILR